MKDDYTTTHAQSPGDICCDNDCSECPYFLRLDICREETATNLYLEI